MLHEPKMTKYLKIIAFLNCFILILSDGPLSTNLITPRTFMFWPNATVPFYINPDHFDHEQSMAIMTALSMFAFKTCVKFAPVMAAPQDNQHVMVFQNPEGIRRCRISSHGHSVYEPHHVVVGYECLKSPQIDMIIMKALGFPFEHNRASRDIYIDVLVENIEPESIELFTKESILPLELRSLPYDVQSVMHFEERDFSKNGHRTIIFKDHNIHQHRESLSPIDLRKLEIVYGPECQKRDRQEKIELCQSYPGVARRKREVSEELKSLRVNPDITPPPEIETTITTVEDITLVTLETNKTEEFSDNIKELGIEEAVQVIVEHAYKLSALALNNARHMYCNATVNETRPVTQDKKNATDLLGVIEVIADYAKSVVDNAVSNLTIFCEASENIEKYQRQRGCSWNDNSDRCRQTYRSTKSGPVRHSTQHRPVYYQSTKHVGHGKIFQGDRRAENIADATEAYADKGDGNTTHSNQSSRKKRDIFHDNDEIVTSVNNSITTQQAVNDRVKNEFVISEHFQNVKDDNDIEVITKATETLEGRTEEFIIKVDSDNNTALRSKRDVSAVTEKKPEVVDSNSNATVTVAGEAKVNTTREEPEATTTKSGFMKNKYEERRFFQSRRFRHKNRKDKNVKSDWDESELSIEKSRLKKNHRGKSRDIHQIRNSERNKSAQTQESREKSGEIRSIKERERERGKEEEQIKEREQENAKMKEERLEQQAKQQRVPKRKLRNVTPKTITLTKLNAEFYDERKWPGGIVRYVLTENNLYDMDDVRRRLAEVNDILQRKTCVRLIEVSEEKAKNYDDYLVIDTSPDYVTGRVGGKQNFGSIELFRGGQHRQHAAMMVMAMLGFYFEIARHDRDKYIRVHMRHVRPDKLHHFEKIREEATMPVPYDFYSATHPAWQFWRKIGKTGISTVATYKEQDPDGLIMKLLGQNNKLLSDIDIVKINSVYGVKCFQNTRSRPKKPTGKKNL